jgi:putative FmdB family regulatory protein
VPTYQYACTACDERLEVVQKFTDDPLTECAACGGRLRKVFSPVGIVFKGSGFYKTDNRGGKGGAHKVTDKDVSSSSKSDSSSSSSKAEGSASKSDSKIA